jgi:hypothetical protein
MGRRLLLVSVLAGVVAPTSALAATINVGPGDSYAKIEAANPGDTVLIAPGTYKFRVYLQAMGTAAQPIVIQAADPSQPPVWDLAGTDVADAPGSYTAGDRGRGCWQIIGSYYQISNIVFQNCSCPSCSYDSAGIRYYQATPGQGAQGILIRGCTFRTNDNGLTGGSLTSDATVEYCEFASNGSLMASASSPSHNVYVYGGAFTMRYSYSHDAIQGTDLHSRAVTSTIEYNWFARAAGFEMQFDSPDEPPAAPFVKTVSLFGNVIVEAASPANKSKMVTLYDDEGNTPQIALTATANTVIGNGGSTAFVELADGNAVDSAVITNNIVSGTDTVATGGTVTGSNNWVETGATTAGVTASVSGSDPGFAPGGAYRLAPGSPCIGKAAIVPAPPLDEYYLDETVVCESRARATALDIGAFESTTAGPGTGPNGTSDAGVDASSGSDAGVDASSEDASVRADGASSADSGQPGSRGDGGGAGKPGGGSPAPAKSSGCGCTAAGSGGTGALVPVTVLGILAAALGRRRRVRAYSSRLLPRGRGS